MQYKKKKTILFHWDIKLKGQKKKNKKKQEKNKQTHTPWGNEGINGPWSGLTLVSSGPCCQRSAITLVVDVDVDAAVVIDVDGFDAKNKGFEDFGANGALSRSSEEEAAAEEEDSVFVFFSFSDVCFVAAAICASLASSSCCAAAIVMAWRRMWT